MKYTASILLILSLLLCLTPSALGGNNPWISTIYFENDLFNGTDSNYTNGVKFSLISPDLSPYAEDGKLPRQVLELVHRIPFIGESAPGYTHKVEFAFGQNMYTPSNTEKFNLIWDDRPYAGWTYGATSYHRKNNVRPTFALMDTVEIQLGIVGPDSLAEETQKRVHQFRNLDQPNGWNHQLKNEPGLVIVFERKWLLNPAIPDKIGYSAIFHTGAALGNVYTYINSGLELRLGWNIPRDFGVSLIRPAGSTRLEIDDRFMIFIFGCVDGRLVGQDIFLDGNTFTDSHSVDKKPFVADVAAGVAANYKNMMLTWTQVLRTKEFKGQKKEHSFGAIAFSFAFPFDLEGLISHRQGVGQNRGYGIPATEQKQRGH